MARAVPALALLGLLLGTATLIPAAEECQLEFRGFPEQVVGPPGAKRLIQGLAVLVPLTPDVDASWSLSMTADGARIIEATFSGLTVTTDAGELRVDGRSFFSAYAPEEHNCTDVAHLEDPARRGAFAALVALSYPRGTPHFLPNVAQPVVLLTLEVTMPAAGEKSEVVVRYEDGFGCAGEEFGVTNACYAGGMSFPPTKMVPFTVALSSAVAEFRRADANADGTVDVSDPIFTLGFLFRGTEQPECEESVDSNDDGKMDISDAMYTILHLFYGGSPPPLPLDECGLDPTADSLSCLTFPPCE
jgi:hypothetical protein